MSRHAAPPAAGTTQRSPGQEKAINTIAQPNFLAVRADVPEEDVYQITKTIYENLPFLQAIHPATNAMSLDVAISGLPVPLHPGAARYYREQGIEIPEGMTLFEAIRAYPDLGNSKRVTFEYVMLKGVNDSEFDHMIRWCGDEGFDLTLIETMPLGEIDEDRTDHIQQAIDQIIPQQAIGAEQQI